MRFQGHRHHTPRPIGDELRLVPQLAERVDSWLNDPRDLFDLAPHLFRLLTAPVVPLLVHRPTVRPSANTPVTWATNCYTAASSYSSSGGSRPGARRAGRGSNGPGTKSVRRKPGSS